MNPNSLLIKNVTIELSDETLSDGSVLIEDGVIQKISQDTISIETEHMVDGNGLRLIPGFIDGHIHGAVGCDVMDATDESLRKMAQALPSEGTTSFVATTITSPHAEIAAAIEQVAAFHGEKGEAEVLGLHVEGPFINEEKAGAQPKSEIYSPNLALMQNWNSRAAGKIKTVTYAPELDSEGEFLGWLQENGVIGSAGHTDATFRDIEKAVGQGLTQVTHLCNAMNGVHHRDVGAVGAAMLLDEIKSELIADRIHVSDQMLQLLFRTIGPDRLMLITDAMRAKGMPDGEYTLGGQAVSVKEGQATLEDGTLAGSVLRMDEAARNMMDVTDATIRDIIQMASVNPAKQLGIFDRKGSIEVGKDADLVIIDENFQIQQTYCKGQLGYSR
ncbi:N-acetylglucosamine-6-phosphate deacetylase [Halalkalibacillus sediminis]|uniref:N-acetylglucosamine-6-phosphate deacetylase n=1 Tax=Halalkalibacillus sediminis TaxID=2018042 RepID=A0A2I0QUJ5_9BACI|nr:N-acetylglucosamine-6-phosphate deacetylase [Halalkalibacillus sediminis]PKR77964.1 N-acetylglucosamine-6-phosphate deacetylase [Halalkalibacillus sediminis]